ncbi:hypothetical protein DLH72_02305, partial [Candidatus Gracilibacteria bacterium]
MTVFNYKIRAFTILENIIIIFIISILTSIGFVVYNEYTSKARDSKRITDLLGIREIMEKSIIEKHGLTQPDNKENSVVNMFGKDWEVGYFGENNFEQNKDLLKLPLDPLTKEPYKYYINSGQYYIVEANLEDGTTFSVDNANLKSGLVVLAPKACSILDNNGNKIGEGEFIHDGIRYSDTCKVKKCNDNYAIRGNTCVEFQICEIENGYGAKFKEGSNFGECKVTS